MTSPRSFTISLFAALLTLMLVATTPIAARTPSAGRTIPVELGREFRLKEGDVARIGDSRDSLRIVRFINSPCPKGAQCIWSGQSVISELTVDGRVVPAGDKTSPYDVTVGGSDYRTYALFVIDRPELACARLETLPRAECLRSLARRRGDPALCRSISDERTRGFCLEELAEDLRRDELCEEVGKASQYCLYVRAKASGDLAACDGIVTRASRLRCFKELSKEGGGRSALLLRSFSRAGRPLSRDRPRPGSVESLDEDVPSTARIRRNARPDRLVAAPLSVLAVIRPRPPRFPGSSPVGPTYNGDDGRR